MKIKSTRAEKIETQMAPMIDVVFQLLIFFMLTLKIVEPEGDFSINMPIGQPQEQTDDIPPQELKVTMKADANGHLARLLLGGNDMGNGMEAFQKLNNQILQLVGDAGESDVDQEVEITADYNLRYQYTIQCIGACTGRVQDGKTMRFIEKIKFSKVKKPADAQ